MPFTVVPADVDELDSGPPEEVVLENAYRKAARVAARGDTGALPVLGVDTVVSLGSTVFGQPRDSDHAAQDAQGPGRSRASGAVGAVRDRRRAGDPCRRSHLGRLRADRRGSAARYLATGEWRGRAGGYAIQGAGAVLVQGLHGDYLNVVGLPVSALLELLPSLI